MLPTTLHPHVQDNGDMSHVDSKSTISSVQQHGIDDNLVIKCKKKRFRKCKPTIDAHVLAMHLVFLGTYQG